MGVHPIPPEAIIAQVRAVAGDIGVDAVKIGMLGIRRRSSGHQALDLVGDAPVVIDPVMVAETARGSRRARRRRVARAAPPARGGRDAERPRGARPRRRRRAPDPAHSPRKSTARAEGRCRHRGPSSSTNRRPAEPSSSPTPRARRPRRRHPGASERRPRRRRRRSRIQHRGSQRDARTQQHQPGPLRPGSAMATIASTMPPARSGVSSVRRQTSPSGVSRCRGRS